MLTGYPLEIVLTTANSAAQAWYGYDQVSMTCYEYACYHHSLLTIPTGRHQRHID